MDARAALTAIIREHDGPIAELAQDIEKAGHQHGTFAIVVTRERVDVNAAELLGFMDLRGVRLFAVPIRAAQRVLLAALAAASARKLEAARLLELPGLARRREREALALARRLGVVPDAGCVHIIPITDGGAAVGSLRRPHV